MTVTQEQAEAVLAAVEAKYQGYWGEQAVEDGFVMPHPTLVMDFDWIGTGPQPAIVWEEGPYEWAIRHAGGMNEETFHNIHPEFEADAAKAREMATEKAVEIPEGLWVEPITSWALAIYEA